MKKSIFKYILKQSMKLISLLIAACILTFILIEKSPIDPVRAYTGANLSVSKEQKKQIEEYWGLNKPTNERFRIYVKSLVKGDLGTSMIYKRPVIDVIKEKFIASLSLMFIAWIISGVLGIMLGILSGVYEGSWIDKIIKVYCHVIMSMPVFWLGILLIMLFCIKLKWLPIGLGVPIGVESDSVTLISLLKHIVLPAITMSISGISSMCLHTREKVVDIMNSEYILFARARGQSTKSIIFKHVLRNISLPAITLQFLSFKELFAGTIFTEQIFSYPGLGKATVDAGIKGDLNLLLGIVIVSLIFVFTGNLIADILYRVIDPRVRRKAS